MVSAVLQTLLALFKAVPVLKKAWDELVSAYISMQYESMLKENANAVRKAVYEKDQRDLEKLLDPSKAGTPSGISGVLPADSLPPSSVSN